MVESLKKLAIGLGLLLLIFGAGVLVGRFGHRNGPDSQQQHKPDTLFIRDTIIDYRPKQATIPAGFELVPAGTLKIYDAVLAAYKDSLQRKPLLVERHDTTYIAVPMSRTTFTDNATYKCLVEGYNTKMLWHESYQEKQIITKPVPYPPTFTISGGFSAFGVGKVFGLGAGIEASLRQGNWAFRPGIGYGLNHDGQNWGHGPYLRFDATYNFYSK
ncbi:MAG: hypothetical protein IJ636_00165 [Bacteroidales bacterium]|nr:hypothetical protein [Bacteroidales bacterium]